MAGLARTSKRLTVVAIALVALLGIIPLAVYGVALGKAQAVHAARALEMLSQPGDAAVLVDVRTDEAFQARHIQGAQGYPLEKLKALKSANDLPATLQGKTLLLVCDTGLLSAQAAAQLSRLGVTAYSVRGGMQDWGRAWPIFQDSPFSRFELEGGVIQEPTRSTPRGEQIAAMLALLWVKPIYMLLSGVVAILLLRSKAADLRLLGWGLLVFLIGEIFCAINYLFLKDNSYLAEYLHSYSMAIAFGLAAYALLDSLDRRILHFSQADQRCAMLPVCGPCAKYQAVRCGVRRMAYLAGIMLVVLAFIPMLSPFNLTATNTQIGPVIHYYVRPFVHQWIEARYSPAIAVLLTTLALLAMLLTPRNTIHPLARLLFCGGVGFLGFSLFRVGLGAMYAETLVWATFWEEITELMFVVGVIYSLWVFRLRLLPEINPPEALAKALQ